MSRGTPDARLSADDRAHLVRWSRSRTLPARVVLRSRIVLLLAAGESVAAVARALKVAPATVRLWRQRFDEQGISALVREAPGRGRKPALDAATRRGLRTTAVEDPMSVRQRARELGVSASTVSRWRRRADEGS